MSQVLPWTQFCALMWCARQRGHGVQFMLNTYEVWIEGAQECGVTGPVTQH
jgi:hypothetical protein